MSVANDERVLWIKNEVLPAVEKELVKSNKENASSAWQLTAPKDAFYASIVFFAHVTLGNKRIDVVIKTPPIIAQLRAYLNTDNLFYNEIVFYTKLCMYYENIPKCVYVSDEPLCNAVIVVENIEKRAFTIVPGSRLNLEYVLAAMQELGRFHAHGYILKETHPDKLYEILKTLRRADFDDSYDDLFEFGENWIRRLISTYGLRVKKDAAYWEKMQSTLGQKIKRTMNTTTDYNDPIAVLCHGDFTKNNVLFKKTDDRIQAMLIDFAQLKYTSPAIDISTLLYVSAFKKDRTERFDDIFKAYHDALLGCLRGHDAITDLEKYSLKTFQEDYRKHLAHGIIIASYFLPAMCVKQKINIMDVFLKDQQEYCDLLIDLNEDAVFEEIIELLVEMNDNDSLNNT